MTLKELIMTDTKQTVMTRGIMFIASEIIQIAVFIVLAINLIEVRTFAFIVIGISVLSIILRVFTITRFLRSEAEYSDKH